MKYQNIKNQKEDKQILGYSIASALSGIMDTRGMKLYQKPSSTPPKISKIVFMCKMSCVISLRK